MGRASQPLPAPAKAAISSVAAAKAGAPAAGASGLLARNPRLRPSLDRIAAYGDRLKAILEREAKEPITDDGEAALAQCWLAEAAQEQP